MGVSYRMVVADMDSNPIAEVPAKNLVYSRNRNAPGSVSFTIENDSPKCTRAILEPGARELHVYREGIRVWGGYLWTAAKEGRFIRFGGEGYLSRFKRRDLPETRTYQETDLYEIAWDLITFSQQRPNGDLGITRFDLITQRGINRTITYPWWEDKNVLEYIDQLSMYGFDYEVTPYKEWKTYAAKGGATPIVFETGKNIKTYTYMLDAFGEMSNRWTAFGKGEGEAKLKGVAQDLASQAVYGIMDGSSQHRDADTQALVDGLADVMLNMNLAAQEDYAVYTSPDVAHATFEPQFEDLETGDHVQVKLDDGYVQVNNEVRISSIVTTVPNEGPETIGYYFDEVFV